MQGGKQRTAMGVSLVNPNILWSGIAIFAAMAVGTAVRLCTLDRSDRTLTRSRLNSLRSWWIVAAFILACAIGGKVAAVPLFAVVSLLALREFIHLTFKSAPDRWLLVAAYALIPMHYVWIWFGWERVFVVFLPLACLFLFGVRMILAGQTAGFVRTEAILVWGMLLTVYCLSHAVLLFDLPERPNPVAGGAGWFLFLVILIESNDIVQALVGRQFGRHKLVPRVSPHKTWEGLLGGLTATALLAVLLAPWLTPFSPAAASAAGLLISCIGLLGDLNMSAVKRDIGAVESGTLLPGQGGILDRVDSLTFAAPLFYYAILAV